MNTIEIEDRIGIQFCHRQPVSIERGEGVRVWDESGIEYLDFTSGWGVTCLGHASTVVNEALQIQAGKIMQSPNSGFTYSPARARLLSLLARVLPANLEKLYFANSGAEANDAALKLARKVTGRTKIVSTVGSFHGRTFNTLSVSGGPENTDRYLPRLADTCFVPFGDAGALEQVIDAHTAAVVIEPIQGEGGVRIPDNDYLAHAQRLCRAHGALLLIDEIQTGFCRTGRFFAVQHAATTIEPDILTMGKGIAGGFPFAAFAVSPVVAAGLQLGDHGGTYCGNPLGCAVSAAVVEYLLTQNVADAVAAKGERVLARLQALQRRHPHIISEVRGKGLLCALQLSDDAAVTQLTDQCLAHRLLVTPTRDGIVRLLPALVIEQSQLDEGLWRLEEALEAMPRGGDTS